MLELEVLASDFDGGLLCPKKYIRIEPICNDERIASNLEGTSINKYKSFESSTV